MRIVPLEIGRLSSSDALVGGDGSGSAALPIPSWLIEHPDGLLLFDTGLHVELQHSTDRLGRSAATFDPDFPAGEELSARLAQHGVRPSDITHMIFSHLHFDHCGGTAEIPDARIVVQQSEWESGHIPKLIEYSVYNPDDFDLGHDRQLIDGEHDVFADGLVRCLPTPGHTKGHQSLMVELASGPVILTGDCIYTEPMLDNMAVPSFGYDTELQKDSMRALASMRDDGCRLLFGHDEHQFRALPAGGLM